jgi:hypothetical protein
MRLFILLIALIGVVSASLKSQDIIRAEVSKYQVDTAKDLCRGNTCCTITDTESCNINTFEKDVSTLVLPGGETRCITSTSTPFAFQVIPGETDKLLFYLQGGGACWDQASLSAGLCTTDVGIQGANGVFDRTDSRNRFKSHTIVHVNYCSGDVHAGNVVVNYTDKSGVPAQQKGLVNAQATLDWVVGQVKAGFLSSVFTEVIVMGCSAGSIGAQLWGKPVLSALPHKMGAVVADSYAGVFPAGTMGPLIYQYGLCSSGFIPASLMNTCNAQTLTLDQLDAVWISEMPTKPWAFIQSKADIVQMSFYEALALSFNTTDKAVSPSIFYAGVNTIFGGYNQANANFLTYLIDGNTHCFTDTDRYYTANALGPDGSQSKDKVGKSTSDKSLYVWTSLFPLAEGSSASTQCDGEISTADAAGKDATYCDPTVVPKTYTEHY